MISFIGRARSFFTYLTLKSNKVFLSQHSSGTTEWNKLIIDSGSSRMMEFLK